MSEKILNELLDIIKSSKQFALEQAPDVFREAVRYEMVSSAMWIAVGLFLLALAASMVLLILRPEFKKPPRDQDDGLTFPTSFAVAILFLISMPVIFVNIDSYLQASIAPKVYLMSHLGSVLHGSCK